MLLHTQNYDAYLNMAEIILNACNYFDHFYDNVPSTFIPDRRPGVFPWHHVGHSL